MVQQRRRNQLSGARIDIERHLLVPRQRVSQLVPVRVGRKQGFTHRCTQCSVLSNCSRGVAALRECWGGVARLLRARANRRLPDRHVDPAGVRSAALVRNHVGERVGSRETRVGSVRHGCLVAGDRCGTVARRAYRRYTQFVAVHIGVVAQYVNDDRSISDGRDDVVPRLW